MANIIHASKDMNIGDQPPPDLAKQEAEIKIAMAECLLSWSEIELRLSMLFDSLVGARPGIGFQVWESVISFEAKLNAINTVANKVIEGEENLKIWQKLYTRISKKSRKRNEIAHSTLINQDNEKIVLVPYYAIASDRKSPQLTAAEIRERTKSFKEIPHALMWFMMQTHPNSTPEVKSAAKAPDLIQRIRKGEEDPDPE